MKSIFLAIVAVTITAFSFAQVTEGNVNYTIEMSSDNPEMQAQFAMLQGSKMNMFFSKDFSRVEFSLGMMMNMITVTDNVERNSTMLMSGMLGNKAVKMSADDIEKTNQEIPKVEVTNTGETKEILGYKCQKSIITTEEGVEVNYWSTDEIIASKTNNKYMNEKINGFPLQFETSQMGMKMTFTAIEFTPNLKGQKTKELFNLSIPEGYEEMSLEELGGMGM